MSKKYSFKKLAEDVLLSSSSLMTALEIWDKAKELGIAVKVGSAGATPWASIGSQIYTEIDKHPEETIFCNPKKGLFGLKNKNYQNIETIESIDSPDNQRETKTIDEKCESSFSERDLHKLLTAYIYGDAHFLAYSKTVYHESTHGPSRKIKGMNHWFHPDIVGVHFPFKDYKDKTLELISFLKDTAVKLYSFEMKKTIDIYHLREYYFQAVSNSSWANEGYLVALNYEGGDELFDEMRILNNAFGIGFIELDPIHVEQSKICIPAKTKTDIDWNTVNSLIEKNKDFETFITSVNQNLKISTVNNELAYDSVLEEEELTKYVKEHKITKKSSV